MHRDRSCSSLFWKTFQERVVPTFQPVLKELGNTAEFSGEHTQGVRVGLCKSPVAVEGWEHSLTSGRCSHVGHVAQELFFCGFEKMQVSLEGGKRTGKGQTEWFQQQMPVVEVLQSTRIEVK